MLTDVELAVSLLLSLSVTVITCCLPISLLGFLYYFLVAITVISCYAVIAIAVSAIVSMCMMITSTVHVVVSFIVVLLTSFNNFTD